MTTGRTLVCGDVHGCIRELKNLLSKAGFRHGADRMVLVGDLVDRGPDSVGVIRYAMEKGALCILGNHEEKHLRYRRHALKAIFDHKYKNPMREPHPSVHRTLRPAEWEWLAKRPLTLRIAPDVLVVHGGFSSDSPPESPHINSCRIRYVDPITRKSVGSKDGLSQPNGTVFWPGVYDGGANGKTSVIYGHETFKEPRLEQRDGFFTLGLDTGCCYGGSLSGFWLEERRFVSVRAVRDYYSAEKASWASYWPKRESTVA